ncbi:MAG: hypothetical protein HY247_05965 [archaeon]|nr:MAG: hypothetical protein HY247_05965 [archaeon]
MYDFDSLVGDLLSQRPELSREELSRRIEEKKKTVGAGYLTDQGALFLVAGEMGISLRKDETGADLRIKDLYIGANDVTVVARVLAVYPISSFNKKEGGEGKYKRLVLFDGSQTARMTIWEEGIEEVEKLNLQTDMPVRVMSGYVKQGLDGKPNLNLGKRGKVEVVEDQKVLARIPELSSSMEKTPKLDKEEHFVALQFVVSSEPRYSEFTRADGSGGSLFQFGVEGGRGEVRVVVWSPSARPELKRGDRVVVTNVRARRSSSGEYEVHGDAGSAIIIGQKAERMKLRVAAATSGTSRQLLCLDAGGKVTVVELGEKARSAAMGDVVALAPDRESGGRLYCDSPESLNLVNDESLPKLEGLVTKLKDARQEGKPIMVEVIALSAGSVDDVRLTDGSSARKGELLLGDDTGEVKLVAWRDASGKVSAVQPGEKLRIVGVSAKLTKMGAWLLEATQTTVLERVRVRN